MSHRTASSPYLIRVSLPPDTLMHFLTPVLRSEGHQFQNNRQAGNPRAIAVDNNTVILQSSTGQAIPSTVIVQAPSAQSTTQLLVSSSNSVISRVYGTDTCVLKRKEPDATGSEKRQRTDGEEQKEEA